MTYDDLLVHVVKCPINVPWHIMAPLRGDRQSQAKGPNGSDYCDFRAYNPGDSINRINWKMLAKRPDHPMVTEYDEERRLTVYVLADVGGNMQFGSQEFNKQEISALLTASIFSSASVMQDFGRYIAYSGNHVESVLPLNHADFASSLARKAAEATLEVSESKASSGHGLREALLHLPSERSLIFVLSDFYELMKDNHAAKENRMALSFAASHHEVICLAIQDLLERELPKLPLSRWLPLPMFLPIADGESEVEVLSSSKNRIDHAARFARNQSQLCSWFESNSCKYAIFRTEESESLRQERLKAVLAGDRLHPCLDESIGNVYQQ